MQVGKGDIVAFELRIPAGSPVAGQKIADVVRRDEFPKQCVFIGVESSSGEVRVPEGETVIEGGTSVILAAHRPELPQVLRCLTDVTAKRLSAEQEEAVQVLSLVGFLSGMAKEDLVELAAGARFEPRKKGEVLYRIGEANDRLYIVRKGAVETESRRGVRTVLRAGAHFGEMSALTGQPRSRTARVVEDAELLSLGSATFRSVLLRNPFLALELAKALSEDAASPA
jgi:hypothetical protein